MQLATQHTTVTGRPGRLVLDIRQRKGGKGGKGGASFPWSTLAFGYSINVATVTIYTGTIRLHGHGNYTVVESTATLTGGTEWVYVEQSKSSPATTSIKHSAIEPETNTTFRRLPLYKFTNDGSGYVLAQICHMGDFNFDAAI